MEFIFCKLDWIPLGHKPERTGRVTLSCRRCDWKQSGADQTTASFTALCKQAQSKQVRYCSLNFLSANLRAAPSAFIYEMWSLCLGLDGLQDCGLFVVNCCSCNCVIPSINPEMQALITIVKYYDVWNNIFCIIHWPNL